MANSTNDKWIEILEDEDLAFIKRFILASGSLKQVAGEYDISYPTVRLRLDRLIQKIQFVDSQQNTSEFERICRVLFIDGKIDGPTFKQLLAVHQKSQEVSK